MKHLSRKKGFTLVEVIVAMSITVLLLAAVMAMFVPVRGVIETNTVNNDVKLSSKTFNDYIERSVSFASEVNVYNYVDVKNIAQDSTANHQFDLLDLVSSYYRPKNDMGGEAGSYPGKGSLGNVNEDPCMMILHWDEENFTYKLYNIPLKVLADPLHLNITESTTDSVIQQRISGFLKAGEFEEFRVFNNSYYGGYKYLLEIVCNGSTCITTNVIAYSEFDDDNLPFELKPYRYVVYDESTDTYTDAGGDAWLPHDDDPDMAPFYETKETNTFDCLNIARNYSIQSTIAGGFTPSTVGYDTIIVYNMREYDIASFAEQYKTEG